MNEKTDTENEETEKVSYLYSDKFHLLDLFTIICIAISIFVLFQYAKA